MNPPTSNQRIEKKKKQQQSISSLKIKCSHQEKIGMCLNRPVGFFFIPQCDTSEDVRLQLVLTHRLMS